MRILQLTPRVAWPPTDGGRVVMLQSARALHELGAQVEVLSLNSKRDDIEAARAALGPIPFDAVDVDPAAHAAALLRALRLRLPPLVARFHSARFEARLRARLRDEAFDVVQVESPFLLPYVPAIRESSRAVVVLRSLNVEFRIWERLAANESHALRRAAYRPIARSLRRYEIAQLNAVDAIVPITTADADDFRALGCTRPMHVLPGGVTVDPSDHPGRPNTAGFLGSLDYRPNHEAALWIAEQLRPRLRRETELHVAGSRAPEWLRERLAASGGTTFHGEVDDAASFIRDMRVMIVPIHSGGGMRIKILDAMAAGKPVVSTSIGAEGIDVTDGRNILLADDPDAFANAIESLLADPARARAIGEAGRALVSERYSTIALTRGLLAFYEELTERSRVRRGDGS